MKDIKKSDFCDWTELSETELNCELRDHTDCRNSLGRHQDFISNSSRL